MVHGILLGRAARGGYGQLLRNLLPAYRVPKQREPTARAVPRTTPRVKGTSLLRVGKDAAFPLPATPEGCIDSPLEDARFVGLLVGVVA